MPFTFCGLHHLRRLGGGLAIKSGRSGFHTDNARPNMPNAYIVRLITLSATKNKKLICP